MKPGELVSYWNKLKNDRKPDKFINLSESIECTLALHPVGPLYIYSKKERALQCDKNYYDTAEKWSNIEGCQKLPLMYYSDEEHKEAQALLKPGKFNIIWHLSGSGSQKVYPWSDYVMGEILNRHKDVHFITTGDERCQILETHKDKDITNISGEVNVRVAMCLTEYVQLVISPDTGLLHASGCSSTPKIGLLGHTTINNITKHFINDFSIEADCACAPCFRLIYDYEVQCPIEPLTRAAWCMSEGINPEKVRDRIETVYGRREEFKR